jgi:NH3-dependent NAD+ synthetase
MGIAYENLDRAILAIESGRKDNSVSPQIISKVKNMIKSSQHKRNPIPTYKKDKG